LVVDQVVDLDQIIATGEGETLGVVDAVLAEAQIDGEVVLPLGQLVAGLFCLVQRTTVGPGIRPVATGQTTPGNVGALATVLEQLAGNIRTLLVPRVLRQRQGDDITTARIYGQAQGVGLDADQTTCGRGCGGRLQSRNIRAVRLDCQGNITILGHRIGRGDRKSTRLNSS